MSEMTIYELREKKKQLEQNIAEMLQDFNMYVVAISKVEVDKYEYVDDTCSTFSVKIEVFL